MMIRTEAGTPPLTESSSERILVLGGTGMLGHKVWQVLSSRFDTHLTARETYANMAGLGLFDECRWHTLESVTGAAFDLEAVVERLRPTVIVNCIGIIKQQAAAKDPLAAIQVNATFPHSVHRLARSIGAYLIQISTDCVFSGQRGHYHESDLPDPPDLYGRSKLLGEIDATDALTLRTSIIGRELRGGHSLVEWFLAQAGGRVKGFANAIFSGVPTIILAETIAHLAAQRPRLTGLYHLAAEPISKYDLLVLLREAYGLTIDIDRDEDFRCDRSLVGARFTAATGLAPPAWPTMIASMAADPTAYPVRR